MAQDKKTGVITQKQHYRRYKVVLGGERWGSGKLIRTFKVEVKYSDTSGCSTL